jgi:hypothetical protein
MTIHAEVIASTVSVLEHHAGVLQRAVDEAAAWLKASLDGEPVSYSMVDRMGDDRVSRLVGYALYEIWEGTVLEVRLEAGGAPWIVSLVNQSCDLIEGADILHVNANAVSWESAAHALLGAITIAVPQLQRSLAKKPPESA